MIIPNDESNTFCLSIMRNFSLPKILGQWFLQVFATRPTLEAAMNSKLNKILNSLENLHRNHENKITSDSI